MGPEASRDYSNRMESPSPKRDPRIKGRTLMMVLGTAVPGFLVGAGLSETADPTFWVKDRGIGGALVAGASGGLLTKALLDRLEERRRERNAI